MIVFVFTILPLGTKAQETPPQNNAAVICGVFAHEMNASQAAVLAANHLYLEADVDMAAGSNWQTIYELSKQYGISLIGKLDHITVNCSLNPNLQDWNDTVQQAVNRYGDIVKIWEIWNEPTDKTNFFNGTAADYAKMLQGAYQIIKAQSNDSIVIAFGGLHLFSGGDPDVFNGFLFAQEVVALGGMNYCDAIGLHAYPWGNNYAITAPAYTLSLNQYRTITGEKPVWITEIGQDSYRGGYTESQQADFLNQSFALFMSQNVSAYIWYELNDKVERIEQGATTTFGLYDVNSQPKLALTTYINLTNSIDPIPEIPPFAILAPILMVGSSVVLMSKKMLRR